MATTYNHIRMSEVDSSGNVRVMYPETTGADVTISRTSNANIPSTVSTAQGLADKLASSAFTNPISDSTTTTTSTWSSNKINTAVTNINLVVNSSGKLAFTNSAGTTSELNFSSASGTATAAQVLTGYTFSNSSGKNIPGEMANKGAWTSTGNNCNATTTKDVTIPAGYHNGSGYVRFNSLSSQTGVESGKTAVDASHMFSGYQGWVNGARVTGSYSAPTINSITPSNASPVSLAANTNYKPSAAGYAISSYSSVTPANGTIPSLASGSIYKMGGAGYAIASYTSVTPTNGNASTAVPALTSGSIYKMGGAGKAVASVTDVAPSNSSPVSVTGYTVYRPTAAGKLVSSVTDTGGSTTGTSYSSNTILRTTGTVYVYSAKPTHTGTLTINSDWTLNDVSVFNNTYNLDTLGFNTDDSITPHTIKYISFPDKPEHEYNLAGGEIPCTAAVGGTFRDKYMIAPFTGTYNIFCLASADGDSYKKTVRPKVYVNGTQVWDWNFTADDGIYKKSASITVNKGDTISVHTGHATNSLSYGFSACVVYYVPPTT